MSKGGGCKLSYWPEYNSEICTRRLCLISVNKEEEK